MEPTVQSSPIAPALSALEGINSHDVVRNLAITLVVWLFALIVRQVVVANLKKRGLKPADLRRLMSLSRDVVLVALVVVTATIWIDELKVFALSLVAVAAAAVIATKELIMGVAGTFLRSSSKAFEIGDRIEVAGVRGDVVDTSLFTTTVLEIGPGHIGHQQTGRALTIPNSLFLTHVVVNETFSDAFVLHTFEVPVARDARWAHAEQLLLDACNEAQAAYAAEARAYFERRQVERGIESPTLDAKVLVRIDDEAKLTLIARLPVPARRKGRIEQAIVHRFLHAQAGTTPASTSTTPPTAAAPTLPPTTASTTTASTTASTSMTNA